MLASASWTDLIAAARTCSMYEVGAPPQTPSPSGAVWEWVELKEMFWTGMPVAADAAARIWSRP
jgi:hypothetical protein